MIDTPASAGGASQPDNVDDEMADSTLIGIVAGTLSCIMIVVVVLWAWRRRRDEKVEVAAVSCVGQSTTAGRIGGEDAHVLAAVHNSPPTAAFGAWDKRVSPGNDKADAKGSAGGAVAQGRLDTATAIEMEEFAATTSFSTPIPTPTSTTCVATNTAATPTASAVSPGDLSGRPNAEDGELQIMRGPRPQPGGDMPSSTEMGNGVNVPGEVETIVGFTDKQSKVRTLAGYSVV